MTDARATPIRDGSGRWGWTTGTCAAGAAKAAVRLLCDPSSSANQVDLVLPDGLPVTLPVAEGGMRGQSAYGAVRKDAGDDPDITDGALIVAETSWTEGEDVIITAGDGVGRVTKKGLATPPGEAAINPVPRDMIRRAVREVTNRGVRVVVSIPGGAELARRTFNPRLGIEGGLSILGTTGRVRPFSASAVHDTVRCSLSVAEGQGVTAPVLVPGHIGRRAARGLFVLAEEQVVEVSNAWGVALDGVARGSFSSFMALGHPGKLAKLAFRHWDTHSARSPSPLPWLSEVARVPHASTVTVEGFFAQLGQARRSRVANVAAREVARALVRRLRDHAPNRRLPAVAVVLVNLAGEMLGQAGEVGKWTARSREGR